MKTFQVYTHPQAATEAVKVGFSWPAFFFSFFWMLAKRLWGVAALWFSAYFLCAIIEKVANPENANGGSPALFLLVAAVYFILWLLPAFKGNQWREKNLTKRGYQLQGTVQAASPEGALAAQNDIPAPVQRAQAAVPVQPVQQPAPTEPIAAPTPVDVDAIYTVIAQELEAGTTDKSIWTRAFGECDGDENQTKARYIRERAERLITAERTRLEQVWHDECARLEPISLGGLASRETQQTRDLTPDLQAGARTSAKAVEHLDDTALSEMRRLGIERVGEQFEFQTYRYDKLSDAIAYAHLIANRGSDQRKGA